MMIGEEQGLWKIFLEKSAKTFTRDVFTKEEFEENLRALFFSKPQKRTTNCPAYYLLTVSDEEFIRFWKYSGADYRFYGGADAINKVNERAKQLKLI